MLDSSTLITYIIIVLGLFLVPGPAVLLVITRTLQGGRKIGLMTGLGIASGDLIHTLCAALGLSALLMTSAIAFNIVKILGACYLIYIGIRAFLAPPGQNEQKTLTSVKPAKAYIQAVGAEVMNPKTAIFFLSFLPQFVHAQSTSAFLQFTVLGVILALLSIVYTSTIVMTIRPLTRAFKKLSVLKRWEGKIIGTIFCSLGVKVALQQQ
jgi:threonine/homoserine/homoserine lactone efflux protein